MQSVRIRYDLLASGWSSLAVILDGEVSLISAAPRTAPLAGLVEAARAIADGQQSGRCAWSGDKGQTRFVLQARGDRLRLRLVKFGPTELFWDDKDGKTLIDCTVDRAVMLRAALAAVDEATYHHRDRIGPVRGLEDLRRAIPIPKAA